MRFIPIALAAASIAAAQTNQTFHLTQNETQEQMNEIATTIRSVGDISQLYANAAQGTVSVTGSAAQLAMAGWMIKELDQSAQPQGAQVYQPEGATDDVVRVFFIAHTWTPQQLQEIATNLRSILIIRKLFIYNPLRAITVRGTSAQMAQAVWMVNQFDQPVGTPAPADPIYKVSNADIVKVYNLSTPKTPRDVQDMVTTIRSIADIQRVFIYNARTAIAMRTTPDLLALADWLIAQLDQPSPPASTRPSQYTIPSVSDNQVRVFYLAQGSTAPALHQAATQVRTNAEIQRLFVYVPLSALAVRGTVSQVATAEKIIEEMK